MRIAEGLLAVSLVVFATGPLFASPIAAADIDLTSSLPGSLSGYECGFYFRPLQDITVTRLGYLDIANVATGASYFFEADGLLGPHEVGLFEIDPSSASWDNGSYVQPASMLLASTTIQSGELSPLDGWFRYESIAPVTLLAGRTYALSSTSAADVQDYSVDFYDYSSLDPAHASPEGASFASAIEFRGGGSNPSYVAGDPLGLPSPFYAPNADYGITDYTADQYIVEFGPNFQFELAQPAAVPEPSSFALLGLAAAGGSWRRRRRSAVRP